MRLRSANLVWKGPDSKHFSVCLPYSWSSPLHHRCARAVTDTTSVMGWLCANKTLCIKTGRSGPQSTDTGTRWTRRESILEWRAGGDDNDGKLPWAPAPHLHWLCGMGPPLCARSPSANAQGSPGLLMSGRAHQRLLSTSHAWRDNNISGQHMKAITRSPLRKKPFARGVWARRGERAPQLRQSLSCWTQPPWIHSPRLPPWDTEAPGGFPP